MFSARSGGTSFVISGDSKRPAIVLIHGLGLNLHMWQYQVEVLKEDYFVISYDLLGHGESKTSKSDPSLSIFTAQLKNLLKYLKLDKVAIIGFSVGGMIARHFAQIYPESLTALAILNSPHSRTEAAQHDVHSRWLQVIESGPSATVDAAIERWFTPAYRRRSPDMIEVVRKWILQNERETYSRNYRVLVDGVSEVVGEKSHILCPTLVLTAGEDFGNGPDMARAIANEFPKAELIVLEGLRHMALFESPDRMNICLERFLGKHIGEE
ncbi:MAG: alpha/beta fold hydrolase [Pseudomonadota bacterium]|nr:alpha/beta fold hydrolase [Pseudomonadota bacterium]